MAGAQTTKTVTIANGASLSGSVNVPPGYRLVGIVMSATWTAAAISLQASVDNSNFADVFSGATEFSLAAMPQGSYQVLANTPLIRGMSQLKVRSGLTGAAVNQGGDRVLRLVFERDY